MDTVKSLRIPLPPDLLRAIRYRAYRERVEESTAARQLIASGVIDYATQTQLYRSGRISLREAADLSGVSVRDMLDLL